MNYTDPFVTLVGNWAGEVNAASVLLRFAIIFVFATVLGWERSRKLHSAGLRTFILTAMTGTAAAIVDTHFTFGNSAFALVSAATVIGAAVISGNTFFFSSKNQVKGLTTSVGLWSCALLGIAVGGGFYTLSAIAFIALLFCLAALPKTELWLKDRSNHFVIHLELKNKESLSDFVTTVRKIGLHIDDIEANPAYIGSGLSVYSVSVTVARAELKKYKKHSEIIDALKTLDFVSFIEEIV